MLIETFLIFSRKNKQRKKSYILVREIKMVISVELEHLSGKIMDINMKDNFKTIFVMVTGR